MFMIFVWSMAPQSIFAKDMSIEQADPLAPNAFCRRQINKGLQHNGMRQSLIHKNSYLIKLFVLPAHPR